MISDIESTSMQSSNNQVLIVMKNIISNRFLMQLNNASAIAKYTYEPQRDDELRLYKGDVVVVLEKSSDGWWKGQVGFIFVHHN